MHGREWTDFDTGFIHSTAAVPDQHAEGINPVAGRRGRNTTAHAAPAKEETSWRRSVLVSRLMSSQVSLGGCTQKFADQRQKRNEQKMRQREREREINAKMRREKEEEREVVSGRHSTQHS